ncbi:MULTISPECIES: peroxiredoxin [Leptospirillum]|jgi:peroxiredoxin|uniref:Peroxiredoxin n=3 Tax=Leptospirillum ferriphilum TaxID=178606 RepID=A0A059XY92_9BACT|nr:MULTISPECIES: peroxiredoxin [Leptospirillum]EAY57409.1 MAG: putative thiol-specific antioxidant protein [Leptospirillum rubarum]EIJ77497.1 MAG: Putative thioredoxin peroxidase [Leptospirillum sp. Group II 'C75']MCL5259539.1 peroxiredoxin [Nitrospirota bacterium]AFS53060.1 putative thiol-specific antioxidant protein [Leptospirillum ferriphilum ML-04]AIA30187.1 peroxiredoxin [Leptospirillum ferriphilum YSK]
MAAEIKVGDKAPDFTLEDQDKNPVTLSSFQGKKNVVLAFYPLDWSPVCTNENTCFSNDLPKFDHANAVVFGISTDSVWSHKAWKESLKLKHNLLSDIKRKVCQDYGLFIPEANINKRATVIVDKSGIVRYVKVQEILTARDDNEILKALEQLK